MQNLFSFLFNFASLQVYIYVDILRSFDQFRRISGRIVSEFYIGKFDRSAGVHLQQHCNDEISAKTHSNYNAYSQRLSVHRLRISSYKFVLFISTGNYI